MRSLRLTPNAQKLKTLCGGFMTHTPQRLARPSSRNLLARVLDESNLPAQIQNLPPGVFCKLIEHVGLEDSGELVAMATTEQLLHAFDEDLWKNERPGEEERFDADRFLVWLEVLLEAGDDLVASKLAEMPEDLVTLVLHKHMLVLDVESLALHMQALDQDEARQLDKALEDCLYEEVEGFQLVARDPQGWDSIFAAVVALDREHHGFLNRVLEHCCSMTTEYIDDNGGLYEVLTSEDMLESDLAADREDRRAEAGHVAPSSATAFLKLARTGMDGLQAERDAVTRAYFRNLRPVGKAAVPVDQRGGRLVTADAPRGLVDVLKDAGVLVEPTAPYLLMPAARKADPADTLLVDAMRTLAGEDPQVFTERSEELAYLTNVLLAGCTFRQRRLRPIEAVRTALATCNLGLCLALPRLPTAFPSDLSRQSVLALKQLKADGLFREGWRRLYADVVERAARVAERRLERLASSSHGDATQQASTITDEERAAAKRAAAMLNKACQQGAPWQAVAELDHLLEAIDGRDVDMLRSLLDQCPTLLEVKETQANVTSETTSSKTTGLPSSMYLSTPALLGEVQRFFERLEQGASASAARTEPHPNAPRAARRKVRTPKRHPNE